MRRRKAKERREEGGKERGIRKEGGRVGCDLYNSSRQNSQVGAVTFPYKQALQC